MSVVKRRSTMRFVALALALVGAAVWAAGCGGYSPDERSTPDKSRQGAQEVPLEIPVTDAVNVTNGDATDWKDFNAPAPGTYTVEVYWDSSYVRGGVDIHDNYGQQIASAARNPGDSQPTRLTFNVQNAAPVYIRIHADDQYSVYSVLVYPGPQRTPGTEVVDPPPQLDRPIQ